MDINELEKKFKALANRRRLAILRILKNVGEMTVGGVAKEIKLSFAATSRHLVLLERSGILRKEQRGMKVFYKLPKQSSNLLRTLFVEL